METNNVKEEIEYKPEEKTEEYNWKEAIASCSKKVKVIKDSEETK